jgi:hypothetical protein
LSNLLLTVQGTRIVGRSGYKWRPDRMYVYDDKVVFEGDRGWIKKREEVIGYRQIAEVVHTKGILQSTITIVNTGGVASIILEHLAPGLAEKAKGLIEEMVRQSWASNSTQLIPIRGTNDRRTNNTIGYGAPHFGAFRIGSWPY